MSQRYIGGLIYNPPGGFSGYFDGSGDYLTIADNIALDMEGSDFTIEGWIFPVVSSGGSVGVFSKRASGAFATGVLLYYDGAGLTPSLLIGSGGSWVINQASSIAFGLGQWNHFAVVRNGTSFVLYINGVAGVSATSSSSVTDNSAAFAIGAWAADGTGAISASYFSNFRVVKGTALYTSAFTPPNGPLQAITNTSLLTCAYPTFRDGSSNNFTITVNGNTAVSTQNPFPQTQLPNPALGNQGNGVYSMSQYQALRSQNLWPAIDPYFDYVTLMLHGNGTNGAQNNTFLDSSTNNFTITRNGNTTQGTFTPYGSNWSAYFNGANGSKVDLASAPLPATGAFTFECFIFPLSFAAQMVVYAQYNASNTNRWNIGVNTSGIVGMGGNTLPALDSTTPLTLNSWNHFAITRDGSGNGKIFVNGVLSNSITGWSATLDTVNPRISGFANPSELCVNGYLSNLRITNTNLYTASFAVPTSPLTAVSGTTLLTLQDNRYKDNSASPITLTPASTSIQRFSPFAPTTPYAADVIGGSGYFDGSGDYLDISHNANLTPSGDFTIEFWAYPTTASGVREWYSKGSGIQVYSNGASWAFAASSNNSGTYFISASFGTLVADAWQHIAVTRSGNSYVGFVNGVATTLGTSASAPGTGTSVVRLGEYSDNPIYPVVGYMAAVRFVNGTAVYGTSNFTPPTAPPTAVSNTQLLVNFTNGGIIDNAMMNNLETVGNAQISTSVSKFGGGSLAFDGTDDRLTAPASPNLAFNTGDFTVEGWIYTGSTGNLGVFQISGTAGGLQANQTNNTAVYCNNLVLGAYYGGTFKTGTTPIAANTWTHFALVRSSSVTRLYVNGVLDSGFGSNSDTQNYTGQNICVGGYFGTSNLFNGNIDDFRVTCGYARYTANFTPQRSQWQDQ